MSVEKKKCNVAKGWDLFILQENVQLEAHQEFKLS